MVTLLEGALRFNPWFMGINVALLLALGWAWYRRYRRTGINLDPWTYNIFMLCVLPFLIMYPFATSEFNVLSVEENNLGIIADAMPLAYTVTLLGFLAIFAGKLVYDRYGILGPINNVFYRPFRRTLGNFYGEVVQSRYVCRGLALTYIFVLGTFVLFTVSQGFASDPRAFFMANPKFRPLYNLTTSLFGTTFSLMATRILQYNQRSDKLLFLPIILFGFFLGVRAPLILQGIGLGVVYVVYRRGGYIPLYKAALVIAATLVLAIGWTIVRNSGSEAVSNRAVSFVFFYEIFYGNTFSDLRDFSWVLGYWDGAHLWGMSYLSAFVSFIPSALLSFRETWGIGRITVNMIGFDPTIHPGLRPGMFGEMFLNFNVVGVMLYGFIWGQVMAKVNRITWDMARTNNVVAGSQAMMAVGFLANLANSAGFFVFYVNAFVLAGLYLCTRIRLVVPRASIS